MVVNGSATRWPGALDDWAGRDQALDAAAGFLRQAIEADTRTYQVASDGAALDVTCDEKVRGRTARACLKLHDYGGGALGLFFYKTSSVPASGDRFSYGGLALRANRVRADQVASWLEFLASGLEWDRRPRGLQRAFQYTVPS